MGKDYKHKYEAKCRQGIEEWKNAPLNLKKKWDRWNFDVAEFRADKLAKIEKEQNKIMKQEVDEYDIDDIIGRVNALPFMEYDITMCRNDSCNKRMNCHRYLMYKTLQEDKREDKPTFISMYCGNAEKCTYYWEEKR